MAASNELKIGVLVLLALVVFTGGVVFLKEWQGASRMTEWKVAFPQVGGLATGDPVLVRGVRQGTVERIELARGIVVTTLRLKNAVKLSWDSQVRISAMGLMGERVVNIDPGSGASPWPPDSAFPGIFASGTPEVMGRLGPILENIDTVLVSLRNVANDLHAGGSLGRTMKTADKAVAEVAEMTAENRAALKSAVEDLRATAAAMRRFTDTREGRLDSTVDRFAEASARLKTIASQFESASTRLNEVATRLANGEGTLGKLSKDTEVYDDLRRTSRELNDLVRDIKENPRKYIKVSLF